MEKKSQTHITRDFYLVATETPFLLERGKTFPKNLVHTKIMLDKRMTHFFNSNLKQFITDTVIINAFHLKNIYEARS